jgi:hypothetical protein
VVILLHKSTAVNMRTDKHLRPGLGLTTRQHFFLSCWFNMVHQSSLDSYRVKVMNPVNVLRELKAMYAPPADDKDRKRVADEALEILNGQPILGRSRYQLALKEFVPLLIESTKAKTEGGKQEGGASVNVLHSYHSELEAELGRHFLSDSFDWLSDELALDPQNEPAEQRVQKLSEIERVCRDVLSVSLDVGFSLESLFQLYRHMAPISPVVLPGAGGVGNNAGVPQYVFMDRLARVRAQVTSEPRDCRVIFGVSGTSGPGSNVIGVYGNVRISDAPPLINGALTPREARFLAARPQWLWADVTVQSRDGRAAGMLAYRQIAQILDLARFYYESRSISITQDFLLEDGGERHILGIPEVIPNPESEQPAVNLEQFVADLNDLGSRDGAQVESRDRIFAAFRLYRVGTEARVFENKLVNWWTGLEYLAKGSKQGGSIGVAVEEALAPALAIAYLSKHLSAYRRVFGVLNAQATIDAQAVNLGALADRELYALFRRADAAAVLQPAVVNHPHLWHHLAAFIQNLASERSIATMLRAHERRLRWQLQRIYRARCDIVHSAHLVVNAALLCANLEFYLRLTLELMLQSFQNISTLRSAAEFFDRQRYKYARLLADLERQQGASDSLLQAAL